MSESSLSEDTPSDATLEQALRQAVQLVYKSGNLEDLTVKRIRKSAEKALGLPEDFFKSDADWKDKSKNVIQSEVNATPDPEAASSEAKSKEQRSPTTATQKHPKARRKKRVSSEEAGPKKRRRKDDNNAESSAGRDSLADHDIHSRISRAKTGESESEMSEVLNEAPPPKRKSVPKKENTKINKSSASFQASIPERAEESESEMSELIDEAPKPKPNRKSKSAEPKPIRAAGGKAKKASTEPSDPDTEEIKKLQGWLVKCGIRKMWFKELAPYDSSKAKINHLKEMLAEAGMTGRYSEAKAEQIKEERELKADLEAVQEGDKMWGQTTAQETPSTGRPRRKLAKGLEGLGFLDDEGEETD
ncbi:hypothetical protein ACLMJK_000288 [Lecanora helva]